MIKIRLARFGARNNPFYRIVVTEKRQKQKGESLEKIGFWNPVKKEFRIDKARLNLWLEKGAVLNPAVKKLIEKNG